MGILAVLAIVVYLMTRDAKRYRQRIESRLHYKGKTFQEPSEKDWKS